MRQLLQFVVSMETSPPVRSNVLSQTRGDDMLLGSRKELRGMCLIRSTFPGIPYIRLRSSRASRQAARLNHVAVKF